MPDGESLGITPASNAATSVVLAYNSVFPSQSQATTIGELSQDTTELNAIGQLSPQVSTDYYSFNFSSGSAMTMAFNDLENTNGGTDPFASDLQVQVLNSAGVVVADSDGTDAQQAAFAQLTSTGGLAASNGQYYVKVNYAPGTTVNPQSYNFQLFSGTTYTNKIVTTALTQPYDPNLFVTAAQSMSPSSNVQLYTRTATLAAQVAGTPTQSTDVGQLTTNESELDVVSQATAAIPNSNYNFNVAQGGAVKLSFANSTDTAQLDVKLVDSNGNVLADSQGTTAQQNAYTELTSGEGLQAAAGEYTVQVGYAQGQLQGSPQTYNFQLNEGTTYNTIYKTSATPPSTSQTYSAGNNVSVYASSDAQLYTRQDSNSIDATASSAVNIGWLKANSTSLAVASRLTTSANVDYYSFTLQQGNDLQMSFNNTTSANAPHVQITDSTGTRVLADNQGTTQQQEAFTQLTSSGLSATPGQYMVKVSYATGANRSQSQNYNFQLYSGTSYTTEDETQAEPESLQTFLLTGGSLGYNSATAAASMLTTATGTNGADTTLNIFGDASLFSTNVFA
jgi:hypothetical protein